MSDYVLISKPLDEIKEIHTSITDIYEIITSLKKRIIKLEQNTQIKQLNKQITELQQKYGKLKNSSIFKGTLQEFIKDEFKEKKKYNLRKQTK